jgi:hypothetical protein
VTLHPALLVEMLRDEVAVARARLGDSISTLEIADIDTIICVLEATTVGTAILRFDAREYDAEPMRLAVITEAGEVATQDRWPGQLAHPQIHPVLGRPWSCTQGVYEYHSWPGHAGDRWDALRSTLRFPGLMDHVVRKARS